MAKRQRQRLRRVGPASERVTLKQFRALEAIVTANQRELSLQFKRIAQIQAELDAVKRAWVKMKGT